MPTSNPIFRGPGSGSSRLYCEIEPQIEVLRIVVELDLHAQIGVGRNADDEVVVAGAGRWPAQVVVGGGQCQLGPWS